MRNKPLLITMGMVLILLVSACGASRSQNNIASLVATGQALATASAVADAASGAASGAATSGAATFGAATAVVPNTGQTVSPTSAAAGAASGASGAATSQPGGALAATAPLPVVTVANGTPTPLVPTASVPTASVPTASVPTATSLAAASSTATQAAAQGVTTGTPNAAGQPAAAQPSPTSIVGIPRTGTNGLIGLAAMFDFRVVDGDGNAIGAVQDYVVNACESNLVYIVVNPAGGIGANSAQQVLIPYQAALATPNSGRVDAANHQFVINVKASDLENVPTFDYRSLDLRNPAWEASETAFWQSHNIRITLTTACLVPSGTRVNTPTRTPTTAGAGATTPIATGTPQPTPSRVAVYRDALASQALSASLITISGGALGTVRDAAVTPATGRLEYLIVEPGGAGQATGGPVAVPLAAVTVRYQASSNQPAFVLLVGTSVFQNAPAYDTANKTVTQDWSAYWQKYVPIGR